MKAVWVDSYRRDEIAAQREFTGLGSRYGSPHLMNEKQKRAKAADVLRINRVLEECRALDKNPRVAEWKTYPAVFRPRGTHWLLRK